MIVVRDTERQPKKPLHYQIILKARTQTNDRMESVNTLQRESKEYIMNTNGKLIHIFKNPSDAQYMALCDTFKTLYPFCPTDEPKTRRTYDPQGNEYYWMSDTIHYYVESFLQKNYGIKCNQNKYFDL